MHTQHPSTLEADTGESWVWAQWRKFWVSLSYIKIPYLKTWKTTKRISRQKPVNDVLCYNFLLWNHSRFTGNCNSHTKWSFSLPLMVPSYMSRVEYENIVYTGIIYVQLYATLSHLNSCYWISHRDLLPAVLYGHFPLFSRAIPNPWCSG